MRGGTKPAGVTVIICTWNRSTLLNTTLESLRRQDLREEGNFDVIVVDNNSTDDTRAVVLSLQSTWQIGRLLYEFEPRQGKQFALNSGIAASESPILAFTDDDILFPPDWIRNIYSVFAASPCDLVGGKTLPLLGTLPRPDWYRDDMAAVLGGVNLGDARLFPPPPGYAPAGGNMAARRRLFDQVGGFSTSHYRHMDYEFGRRCAELGVRIAYEPSLIVYAPVAESCLTRTYFRRWAFKAGVVGSESDPPAKFPLLVPAWVITQLASDGLSVLLGNLRGGRPAETFSREIRFWRRLGLLLSRWHARLWPNKHDEWVVRHSQKKKNNQVF